MAKFKPKNIITPVGELMWVFISGDGVDKDLNDPSKGKCKKASIYFHKDSKEAQELKAKIDAVWEEYRKFNSKIKPATKPKSLGYKFVKDDETGEDTDIISFNFSTNSFLPNGKPNIIDVFSANGKKLEQNKTYIMSGEELTPKDATYGPGTIGCIYGAAGGYEYNGTFGISLYLQAIQLKKYVPFKGIEVKPEVIGDEDVEVVEVEQPQEPTETPEV